MNENIYNCISEYANIADPQYAIMLKGKWGCGKTYFIKKWIEDYKKEHKEEDTNSIDLKPIYVSLYGMKSIKEVNLAIDRELNPLFYGKAATVIKGVANLLGKVVFNTKLDFDGNCKDETTLSTSLDALSFLRLKDESIKGVKFIVFDDLERCLVEMKSLLGYINFFVEHCGCHVIIIGDTNHLERDNQSILTEFKEKTIGREFEILPDVEGAIDYFLEELSCNYLKSQRDIIIKVFKKTETSNLRLLRQCLFDFRNQLNNVEEPIEETNFFLRNFLMDFIVVYAEYNQVKHHDLIKHWYNEYNVALFKKDDENNLVNGILRKYSEIYESSSYSIWNPEMIQIIADHISTGMSLSKTMVSGLSNSSKVLPCWERLDGYYKLDNHSFKALCKEVVEALTSGMIESPYIVGTMIGFLGHFDANDLYHVSKTDLRKIFVRLSNLIKNADSLQNLYRTRSSFIQGCNYVKRNEVNIPLTDIFIQHFNQKFDERCKELPDPMQKLLRSISEENVKLLEIIDKEPYPDRSSDYTSRAIFESENASVIFDGLKKLTNEGRHIFAQFVASHYMFGCNCKDIGNRYVADKPVLQDLKYMIDNKVKSTKILERMSYKAISDNLERAIKRCEGVSIV